MTSQRIFRENRNLFVTKGQKDCPKAAQRDIINPYICKYGRRRQRVHENTEAKEGFSCPVKIETISPLTAGLGYFVKMEKPSFIGKNALEKAGPPAQCRVGLKAVGRGIPREHQDIYIGDKLIGQTTSGTHCPYVGYPASMAIIDVAYKAPGTVVEVDVRGRRVEAEVVKLPFYKK